MARVRCWSEHRLRARERQAAADPRRRTDRFLGGRLRRCQHGRGRPRGGVSKGTLYVYFDSKEELFEALIIQEKSSLAEALFTLDAENPDVPAVLTRLGTSFLTEMCRPEHMSVVRMVIGACEKFPRFGQAFYEAGPACGVERLSGLPRRAGRGRPAEDRRYGTRRPSLPASVPGRFAHAPAIQGRRDRERGRDAPSGRRGGADVPGRLRRPPLKETARDGEEGRQPAARSSGRASALQIRTCASMARASSTSAGAVRYDPAKCVQARSTRSLIP